MTEQEKTFIAREFDKLENQLDSKYSLYENGYQSALFDALEVVNKLPIHTVVGRSEQLVSFLRQYQKACEIMHVNKIDAKNFVEQYKTN